MECVIVWVPQINSQLILFRIEQEASLHLLSYHNLQLFTPEFTRLNPPNQTSSPLQPSMQTYNKMIQYISV